MNTAPKKSFWVSWFCPFPSHCVILNTIFCRLALASLTLLVCLPVYWFFFPELWAAWATIGQPLYWAMVVLICLSECSVVWLDRLKLSLYRMQCHKEKMHDLYFRQQVRQLIGQERGVVYFAWYLIDGNPVKKHFLFAYWEFHWGRSDVPGGFNLQSIPGRLLLRPGCRLRRVDGGFIFLIDFPAYGK